MLCPAVGRVFSCSGVWAAPGLVTQVRPCGRENQPAFLQSLLRSAITERKRQLYSVGSLFRVMMLLFCKWSPIFSGLFHVFQEFHVSLRV